MKGEFYMAEDLVYVGFSSHDCESIYKCPCCGTFYYSWNLWNRGIKNGDVFECDHCKVQLRMKEAW